MSMSRGKRDHLPSMRRQRLQASLAQKRHPDIVASNTETIDTPTTTPVIEVPMDVDKPEAPSDTLNEDNPTPEQPEPQATPPTPVSETGRPRRTHRLPLRFRDPIPERPAPVPPPAESEPGPIRRVVLYVLDKLVTKANSFGIWREYPRRPTVDPDACIPDKYLANPSHPTRYHSQPTVDESNIQAQSASAINESSRLMLGWMNNGNTSKSEADTDDLVQNVLLNSKFKVEELHNFRAHKVNMQLDKELAKSKLAGEFLERSVDIPIPSGNKKVPPRKFTIPGLLYRPLTSVIKAAFNDPLAHLYHFSPFKVFHRPDAPIQASKQASASDSERVYGELYSSDAFLTVHDDVQRHGLLPPDEQDCQREKVVAALMFSSDATHLTDFGSAKAWPIYMMLGNLSKYIRSQPSCRALHHLAYIPSLPDALQDFASTFHAKWQTQHADILTHCQRELMHAVWSVILDDEFVKAYTYGIVIECIDGIERRVYPRIFTYSADYPEKVLLATMRDKGLCPCPRCLVSKSKLDRLGQVQDQKTRTTNLRTFLTEKVSLARDAIYRLGMGIKSAAVERLLKETSSVPTMNAFVERLGPANEPSMILVVDLLHEFELGVWKTLFTHLIRLLYAVVPGRDERVVELDRRYRQISTFGRGTIRKFSSNASEMKKLAARDFEDLLQCAIPVFEGLLPEPHNGMLVKLLYRTAEWHSLAKLRMHTDTSLKLLDELTTEFGKLLRQFRDITCSEFATMELPREAAARRRRNAKNLKLAVREPNISPQVSNQGETSTNSCPGECLPPEPVNAGRKARLLNLFTIKLHFLGDYVRHIKLFGTTDSYSTQLGELAHRFIKCLYGLTNKKMPMKQIGRKQVREEAFRGDSTRKGAKDEEQQAEQANRFETHHIISHSRNDRIDLFSFTGGPANAADPAKEDFIPKLQDHLLRRLLPPGPRDKKGIPKIFTDEDRRTLRIVNGSIFEHHTASINYTTYDIRRDYDTINPSRHPFVMVRSPETGPSASPYWYASVLGVFHADVQHVGRESRDLSVQQMEFLWVRWFAAKQGYRAGRKYAHLPKIGFVPFTDDEAFGFLDPALVIRGCHLIPAFMDGRTSELLPTKGPTACRRAGETDDWRHFYVGIFVDRDMHMRFLRIGVGHLDVSASRRDPETSREEGDEGNDDEFGNGDIEGNSEQEPEGEDDDGGDDEIEDASGEEDSDDDDDIESGDDLGYEDL